MVSLIVHPGCPPLSLPCIVSETIKVSDPEVDIIVRSAKTDFQATSAESYLISQNDTVSWYTAPNAIYTILGAKDCFGDNCEILDKEYLAPPLKLAGLMKVLWQEKKEEIVQTEPDIEKLKYSNSWLLIFLKLFCDIEHNTLYTDTGLTRISKLNNVSFQGIINDLLNIEQTHIEEKSNSDISAFVYLGLEALRRTIATISFAVFRPGRSKGIPGAKIWYTDLQGTETIKSILQIWQIYLKDDEKCKSFLSQILISRHILFSNELPWVKNLTNDDKIILSEFLKLAVSINKN